MDRKMNLDGIKLNMEELEMFGTQSYQLYHVNNNIKEAEDPDSN